MLKRFRLFVELDYSAKKQAKEAIRDLVIDQINDIIEGRLPPSILIDYMTDDKHMDEMLMSFVFNEDGDILKSRLKLSANELDLGCVSVEDELEDKPIIVH